MELESSELEHFRIRELLERYFNSIDAKDREGLAACFATEAQMTANCGNPHEKVWQGGREIAANIASIWLNYNSSHHTVSSVVIRITGAEAHARTFAIANVHIGDSMIVRGLRYDDFLTQRDGQWLLVRRRHNPLWQMKLPTVPVVPAHRSAG